MIIYILTYSMLAPGTPAGHINDLFENAFTDMESAERAFNGLVLTREYFRKEMWIKDTNGTRKLLKEKRFNG